MFPLRQTPWALLLFAPALIVLGGVLYAAGAPELVVGVLQVAGWLLGALAILWLGLRWLRRVPRRYCLAAAGASVGLFVASVLLHNIFFAIFGFEEGVFFTLAMAAPLLLAVSIVAAVLPRHATALGTP